MIRARIVIEIDVDPDAWHAALKEEWIEPGEVDPADEREIAMRATGYIAAEDRLPRWARSAMTVVSETLSFPQ
jgi:hypothetical protein